MIIDLDTTPIVKKLESIEDRAAQHYPPTSSQKLLNFGGLREILSVWIIKKLYPYNPEHLLSPPLIIPEADLLQPALDVLNKNLYDVLYAYYAIIPPGKQIYEHVDTEPYFLQVNRYQVFFNVSPEHLVIQENLIVKSNSMVLFDVTKPHAYKNNSLTESFKFIVFDVPK